MLGEAACDSQRRTAPCLGASWQKHGIHFRKGAMAIGRAGISGSRDETGLSASWAKRLIRVYEKFPPARAPTAKLSLRVLTLRGMTCRKKRDWKLSGASNAERSSPWSKQKKVSNRHPCLLPCRARASVPCPACWPWSGARVPNKTSAIRRADHGAPLGGRRATIATLRHDRTVAS